MRETSQLERVSHSSSFQNEFSWQISILRSIFEGIFEYRSFHSPLSSEGSANWQVRLFTLFPFANEGENLQ